MPVKFRWRAVRYDGRRDSLARPSTDLAQQAESQTQFRKKEQQADQREDGQHQRAGEEHAEQLMVVFQVHVEHDHDHEFNRRHDQHARHIHP